MRQAAGALLLGGLLAASLAGTVSAHPLGNATVNRSILVEIGADGVRIEYVVDMAEIPAFVAIEAIDADHDGSRSVAELGAYAEAECAAATAQLEVLVDDQALAVSAAGDPSLQFPPGVGGLETLRLECPMHASLPPAAGERSLTVVDHTADVHLGWREVVIGSGAGIRLLAANVPATSPSGGLRAYPEDRLQAPPDVRSGMATFVRDGIAVSGSATHAASALRVASDPLVDLLSGDNAALMALALLVAAALGAAHALSPGHGKTLVAAYLVGSRGTLRQAVTLGLTVAGAHTLGVFVLGAVTLGAGELLAPEALVTWLAVASGVLVIVLGIGLLIRARQPAPSVQAGHSHGAHEHPHAHPHPHRPSHPLPQVSPQGLLAMGLAGGMVPSTSALIVLLAAITTGRLLFGIALIGAFGLGMAAVLAGLAALTTRARGWLVDALGSGERRQLAWAIGMLPIGSGLAVVAIGVAVTLGALWRIG